MATTTGKKIGVVPFFAFMCGVGVLGYSFCHLPSLLSRHGVFLSHDMRNLLLLFSLHHIDEEFPSIAHRQAQRLARGCELRGHRGQLPAWWGARCSCRQMWWLGGQAGGAVDQAGGVGY